MSRKNKILRAFLHQNQNPTIEQAWDAAWKHAQKTYHARSMQDMGEKLAAAQAECEKLRLLLSQSAPIVHAHAGASHMLDGFKPKRNKWDALVEQIDAALAAYRKGGE